MPHAAGRGVPWLAVLSPRHYARNTRCCQQACVLAVLANELRVTIDPDGRRSKSRPSHRSDALGHRDPRTTISESPLTAQLHEMRHRIDQFRQISRQRHEQIANTLGVPLLIRPSDKDHSQAGTLGPRHERQGDAVRLAFGKEHPSDQHLGLRGGIECVKGSDGIGERGNVVTGLPKSSSGGASERKIIVNDNN